MVTYQNRSQPKWKILDKKGCPHYELFEIRTDVIDCWKWTKYFYGNFNNKKLKNRVIKNDIFLIMHHIRRLSRMTATTWSKWRWLNRGLMTEQWKNSTVGQVEIYITTVEAEVRAEQQALLHSNFEDKMTRI